MVSSLNVEKTILKIHFEMQWNIIRYAYIHFPLVLPPVMVPKAGEPLPSRDELPPIHLEGGVPGNATYDENAEIQVFSLPGTVYT